MSLPPRPRSRDRRLPTTFLAGLVLSLGLLLWAAAPAAAARATAEGTTLTFWPLVDWRSSPATEYAALHLLGPLFKWQARGEEREVALRPLFYYTAAGATAETDVLFPLIQHNADAGYRSFDVLSLLSDQDDPAHGGGGHRFTLFPLIFYDRAPRIGTNFALFPLGGRIRGRFNRDEIDFALFPLYGRTRKGETTVTNLLWPFFALVDGPGESGFKAWPLFGFSSKKGSYRKRFLLWPLIFDYDLALDTDHPQRIRSFWPFYGSNVSPQRTTRVVLWPFFSFREDREKGYKKWDFPWPLLGVTRGNKYYGNRFFPIFAYDTNGEKEKLWLAWPIYRFERLDSPALQRRRHSVLFFLYRDQHESVPGEQGERLHRVTFWPLFRYQRLHGVADFSLLALLEPIFPESDGVERNWAPLWRIYHGKWDRHGNRIDSLLWNLFWLERRPNGVAMELFPLFSLREAGDGDADFSLFKGLFRYRRCGTQRTVRLFYLPWGVTWGETAGAGPKQG